MDNAAFHKKNVLQNFAGKYSQRLIFLPPYSLECLPIEHTWNALSKKLAGCVHLYNSVSQALDAVLEGVYITSLKLCIEYESGADFKSKRTKLETLEYYVAQKMLVIDEVGRFCEEKTERTIIPAIINMRYEDNLPTVIISNLSKKEIIEHFGKATYDRMTETCTAIDFQCESMRLQFRGSEAKGA